MNNIYYLLILAAIYVAWQVVSHLYESAKQKELERQKGQMRGGRPAGSGPSRAGATTPRGTSSTPRGGWDDLAARRRAQLEQLRARREARPTARPASVRTGRPVPPTAAGAGGVTVPGRPVSRPQPRATPQVDVGDWLRQQRSGQTPPRRAPVALRPEVVQGRRPERAPAARGAVEPADESRAQVTEPEIGEPARHARVAGTRAQRLLGRLQGAASLHELFLLKEVLDPPVGMRSPGAIGGP
ncbi:MAG: hypothetical protein ACYSTY_05060 [Planctomycetota bacterium]